MRPLSPRVAVAVMLSALLVVTTPAVTATAASRPDRVGLVSFTGASLTPSGATLTVDWKGMEGVTAYEVFASTSYDSLPTKQTPTMTVTGSKATLRGLAEGRDYFVQVRAVNSAGPGLRSLRVGHGTMTAEASLPSTAPRYRALSWNICSNACPSFSTRAKVINSRIAELKPDVVALQEASRYSTAPRGYRFAYNGQNDILIRSSAFTQVTATSSRPTSGYVRPGKKYATPGKGFAWAAVRHSSGRYLLVVDVHLVVGTSGAALQQREYEASRVGPFIRRTLAQLDETHGSRTDWTTAPVIVLGDFNTHKSRTGDDTMKNLEASGWHDAFDQARSLTRQHHNTANPDRTSTPVIGILWGAHVDKALVRPSRSVVYSWANAGEMSGTRYATPLGSDHHPLLVELGLK